MMYQPYVQMKQFNKREFLQQIDIQGHTSQYFGQFLYSFAQKNSKQKILIVSQELNQNDQTIVHNVFYDFQDGKETLSFLFDKNNYEGQWILFYFFIDQLQGTTTLGFYQASLNSAIPSQTINYLPEFEDIMIHKTGGLQYYINENQDLIILNQFKGIVSCALSAGNFDYETSIFQCQSSTANNDQCYDDDKIYLIENNQVFQGSEYLKTYSFFFYNPKYYLYGWVRLEQLEGIELITQLIRITINFDYGDDLYIGDRDLLIKYYQNIDPQLNGFEISTYSYSFPVKGRYQTPDELKIKVLGAEYQQAIIKWHYIQYEIGIQIENYQPLFQIFSPDFDEIKQFRFPIQVQHFTGTEFIIIVGGDEYSPRNIKGEIFDLVFHFPCDEPTQKLPIQCHYSCLDCFGPTKQNCLSCSQESFRIYSILQNTCDCILGYFDFYNEQICQQADQAFSQMNIEEIPLNEEIEGYDYFNENQFQCSFGYFPHENSCIKCPYYEDKNSNRKITCLNCFIDPTSFAQSLECLQKALTFDQNLENSYQISSDYTKFVIVIAENGQKSLELCEGCFRTYCLYGYFQRNGKCIRCSDWCSFCNDEYHCIVCDQPYYLADDKTCHYDQDFGSLNDDESFCQYFDNFNYCNYCIDSPKQFYLTFDGKTCRKCNLDNCQYCFEYIQIESEYLSTFDIQFKTYKENEAIIKLGCALCESNYNFNFNTNKCELKPQDNDCIFAIIEQNNNVKCIIGSIEDDAIQVSQCSELKFCKQCIKNYIQQFSFCIVCMDGYYAGILSGQCSPCPKECKSCVQQFSEYNDQWKWDIKAFYKYFLNSNGDHSFENFASSNDLEDLEIICTQCPEQYLLHDEKCIQGCAEGCQQCEIIINQAICTKCPKYQEIQLKSQDEKGSCLICPKYCSACLERSYEEIARINPYFVLSSENIDSTKICYEQSSPPDDTDKYFIDTRLFSVSRCQKYNKCQKKVTITNIIYCDSREYFDVLKKNPKLRQTATIFTQFFRRYHLQYLESQQIYDYLQEIMPFHVIYEFQFKLGNQQSCSLSGESDFIAVQIQQKIFSVQQVDIKFKGLEKFTRIRIVNGLNIHNFTNIIFENLEFDFSYDSQSESDQTIIQLSNLNYNVLLTIQNCIFTTTESQSNFSVSFESSHSYSAIIEDVQINHLIITQSKLFSFNSINQQNKGKIIIRNLRITDSVFLQTSLLIFNSSYNYDNEFYAEKVHISNCQFIESVVFQSSLIQNFNIGTIDFKDFMIENSIFQNSSFVNVENAKNLRIEQLQVNDLTIDKESKFYVANVLKLINSKFDRVKLHNDSKLIINEINLDLNLGEQLHTYIANLQIINTEYDSTQSIMCIKQQRKLEFYNISLSNNYQVGRLNFDDISFSQSTIYIECQVCILENIDFIRLYGLPEISIMNSDNITMRNVKLIQNSEFHPKMLHSDYNCIQGLIDFEMSFFIYFGKYQNISIHNIQISESYTFNAPFLIFQGYDLLEKVQNESISIFDSIFENNLLLIYREFSSSSILYFDSNQYSVIEIVNSHFLNNHLNEHYQNLEIKSATTLVVLQRSGKFNIKECSFVKNILTNSSDSILYVKTQSVQIKNTIFFQNNLLQYLDLNKNLLLQIKNKETLFLDDLEKYFPVQSDSGNGLFNVNNFSVLNSLINQSYAYSSGGFKLILVGQSFVIFGNSQFYQTRTTLDSNIFSQGGCLYVDALQSSLLNFNVSNVSFDTSYSRTEGGGIYIIPSNYKNLIHFKNLTIKNCFAIKNSFMSLQIIKTQSKNSQFISEEQSFKDFLQNLDDFTSFEAESILLQNPLIYARYGNITLKNCSFVNTYQQYLLHTEESQNIILNGLRFIKSSIRKSPLIKLSLRQQQKGLILIKDVVFAFNMELKSPTNIQCLTKQSQILVSSLQLILKNLTNQITIACPKSLFLNQQKQFEFSYLDNTKFMNNQLQCNLKLLENNADNQFSLMEIINVEIIHFIQIQNLKFENNDCKGCYNGLLKIIKSDTVIKELLKIRNLDIINNICGVSGCFSFLGQSSTNPYRSDLMQNRLLQYQNIKNLTQRIKYDINIEDSQFLNNTAKFGGAITIIEAQAFIYNCEFKFNTAKIGGAIQFFADQKLLILIQSKITHNTAQIAGGIFLNNQSLQELQKVAVDLSENNSTVYGSDFIESPRSLSLIVNKEQILLEKKIIEESSSKIVEKIVFRPFKTLGYKNKLQFLTLPSGRSIGNYEYFDSYSLSLIPYNLTFRIIPLNKFNEQIKGLDEYSCYITPVAINSSSNENVTDIFYALSYYSTQYNKETQDFNFDDLVIYFNPNYDESLMLRLVIECDFIQIPIYDEQPPYLIIDYMKNYHLQVDIKTFKCQLGEYLNVTSGGCVLCDSFQNQYQVSWSAQNCSFKDDIKMKSIESSKIELRSHYWRAYYYSSTIEHCYHLEENCLGGWIPGDDSCILGHLGALCEQCDLYNSRGDGAFSVSQTYSCGSCDQITANLISIIFISIWTLISTMMSVSSTVQMIEEFIIGLKLKQFKIIVGIQTASTAILIKIVTNYLQIISSIATFQLQIPPGVLTTFKSVGNPIEQMAYSLDCLLISLTDIDIIYFRIIWSVLMAIFYIAVFLPLGILSKLLNQINFTISHISTAILYIYIFMSPSIIQGLISLLSYRVISDEYWVQGNVSYRYDTYQHLKWSIGFSLPLLVFIGCFLPFLFWLGLNKNRNNLDSIVVRKIWGYLYNEYKKNSYYWEIIKIVQREFMIIVLVYYEDFIPIKASLVFLILFAYSYSTQSSKPYATGELNHLDSQSTIVCAVSIILGSSIFSAQQNNLQEIIWPFYIVITLLNLLFISKMILKILFTYFKKLSEKIDKVKEFIIKRCPCVLASHQSFQKLFELSSTKEARIKQKYQKIREKLMPQIRKWLIYKRNNLFLFTVSDDSKRENKINSFEEFQVLSFSDRKCQTSMLDQQTSSRIHQNVQPWKIYPANDLIEKQLSQQQ